MNAVQFPRAYAPECDDDTIPSLLHLQPTMDILRHSGTRVTTIGDAGLYTTTLLNVPRPSMPGIRSTMTPQAEDLEGGRKVLLAARPKENGPTRRAVPFWLIESLISMD